MKIYGVAPCLELNLKLILEITPINSKFWVCLYHTTQHIYLFMQEIVGFLKAK